MKIRSSWTCVVVEVFLGLVPLVSSAQGKLFRLHLKTTGCEHTCAIPSTNSSCPSSILINGREHSHQLNGFNIAIIDNKLGMVQSRHFSYFSKKPKKNASPLATAFRNYFANVTNNSTVIVVLQNVCSRFHKRWFTYLRKAGVKIASVPKQWRSHNIALIVGCKGSCFDSSNTPLPFGFYGNKETYKKSITLDETLAYKVIRWNTKEEFKRKVNTVHKKKQKHVGTILGGIIAVVFAVGIAIILYVTNKRPMNGHLLCWMTKAKEMTPEHTKQGDSPKTKSATEDPLLEQVPRYEDMDMDRQNDLQQLFTKDTQHTCGELYDSSAEKSPIFLNILSQSDEQELNQVTKTNTQSPSFNTEISSFDVENGYTQPLPTPNRQLSNNITSVCSLVSENCHNLDLALLQPASVCSLIAEEFLSERSRKIPSRSNSSRRHSRRHSRKNNQQQDQAIGRSESSPDVISHQGDIQ